MEPMIDYKIDRTLKVIDKREDYREQILRTFLGGGIDMQELEKILEEIEEGTHTFELFGRDVDFVAIDWVRDVIRKHMNDGWIPVDDRLPEPRRIVLITQAYSWENFEEGASVTIGRLSPEKNNKMWEFQYYRPYFRSGTIMDNGIICPGNEYVIAWRPLPEPYRPERSENHDGK